MAKNLYASFSNFTKLLISGSIALVLVGGAITSMSAMSRTQNTASKAYESSPAQCFNRVRIVAGSRYYWPDACRGKLESQMCAQVVTELTSREIATYKLWVSMGKPMMPGKNCGSIPLVPTPSSTPVSTSSGTLPLRSVAR